MVTVMKQVQKMQDHVAHSGGQQRMQNVGLCVLDGGLCHEGAAQ